MTPLVTTRQIYRLLQITRNHAITSTRSHSIIKHVKGYGISTECIVLYCNSLFSID